MHQTERILGNAHRSSIRTSPSRFGCRILSPDTLGHRTYPAIVVGAWIKTEFPPTPSSNDRVMMPSHRLLTITDPTIAGHDDNGKMDCPIPDDIVRVSKSCLMWCRNHMTLFSHNACSSSREHLGVVLPSVMGWYDGLTRRCPANDGRVMGVRHQMYASLIPSHNGRWVSTSYGGCDRSNTADRDR
jgi:hypothetical protein